MVYRQHIERTAPAIAAAAGVQFEAEHGERIQANTHGALGKTRLEPGNDGVGPGFGITVIGLLAGVVRGGCGIAVVAVEVEVAVEHAERAALDKALRGLVRRHRQVADAGERHARSQFQG